MNILDSLALCMLLQNPEIPAPPLPTAPYDTTDSGRSIEIAHAGAIEGFHRWSDGEAILNDRGEVVR